MPQTARQRLVGWCQWGIAHAPSIHYGQVRPIPNGLPPGHLPLTTDCSGILTIFCEWAKVSDPNGNNYDGSGYTGTMLAEMEHIAYGEAAPGDFGVFSQGNDSTHVIALLATGADPYVFSHGTELGPLRVRLSVERSYHAGETLQWLRLPAGFKFWRWIGTGGNTSEPKTFGDVNRLLESWQRDPTHDHGPITLRRYKDPQK